MAKLKYSRSESDSIISKWCMYMSNLISQHLVPVTDGSCQNITKIIKLLFGNLSLSLFGHNFTSSDTVTLCGIGVDLCDKKFNYSCGSVNYDRAGFEIKESTVDRYTY